MSQLIGERRHEIAVRVALGATARNLVSLVTKQAARLVGLGIALGVLTAVTTARLLQGLLFRVSATDAASFIVAVGAVLIAAAIASYIPARRAVLVDPVRALRSE